VTTFSKTCYDFHITKGESFDKAQAICKQTGELVVRLVGDPSLALWLCGQLDSIDKYRLNYRWRLGTRLSGRHQSIHIVGAGAPEDRAEAAARLDWRPKGAGHHLAHLEVG